MVKKGDFTIHSFTVPGELPGLNTIIEEAKSHHMAYANLKEEYTEKVAWKAKSLPEFKKVYLNITYYCANRRRDPDNIAAGKKFLIDGLVEADVLENDGWNQVKGWNENFKKDKENPRVHVEIMEMAE